jgi:cytochrome P450
VGLVSLHKTLPPGPKGHWLFGNSLEFRKDPFGFLMRSALEFGDIVYLHLLTSTYFISHPDHIKYVLQDNAKNYTKSAAYKPLKTLLGNGLVTNEGNSWKHQRSIMSPAFYAESLKEDSATMIPIISSMLDEWEKKEKKNIPINALHEMISLTFSIIGKTMFEIDLRDKTAVFYKTLTESLKVIDEQTDSLILGRFIPTLKNFRLYLAIKKINREAYKIIDNHCIQTTRKRNFLSLLFNSLNETPKNNSKRQLRDEVVTILFAGHETTANALTWALYLLCKNPSTNQKLSKEANQSNENSYAEMVIKEAMRIYPPIWNFERTAICEDKVGDYTIPAGTTILISPYVTHRHPEFWGNPEMFIPERFAPTNEKKRYSYIPFAGGLRQCIGMSFALTESKLVLSMIAKRFEFELVDNENINPEPLITLRPQTPMFLKLKRRS